MAEAMSGTMPSPTIEDFTVIEQMREQIPASEVNETLLATAAEADPMAVAEFKAELRDLELPVEVLDVLNDMVDEILAEPERYDEIRAHYKTQDMPDDMLPETFDPEFFGALNMALDEIRATSGAQARAPQGFAMGGIASLGRNGDTMLAHVTPAEMKMLKDKGGAGTINPRTGLPEFFSLSKVFKKIGKAVKKFASSTIGKVVISAALFMTLGPIAAGKLGFAAGSTGSAAVSGFVAGAGSSLLAGNNLKDSLKAGAIGGITSGALQGLTPNTDITGATGNNAPVIDKSISVTDVAPSSESLLNVPTAVSPGQAASAAEKIVRSPLSSAVDKSALTGGVAPNPVTEILNNAQANVMAPVQGTQAGFTAGGVESLMPPQVVTPPTFRGATIPSGGVEGLTQSVASPMGVEGLTQSVASPMGVDRAAIDQASQLARLREITPAGTEAPASGFFESIKETFTPDRSVGLGERVDSLKEAFSPSAIEQRYADNAFSKVANAFEMTEEAVRADLMSQNPTQLLLDAYNKVKTPGMIAKYAPLAGAGLGIMALSGGFEEPSSELPAGFEDFMAGGGGQRLIDENPDKYRLRFGGINPLSSYYFNRPTYNAAMGSGPQGVDPNDFPRMNGPINGPGTGTSDDVPAMLSDGEFVFTAKAVRNMGDGSRRKGAKRMYAMMKKLENRANG
jgi:hypothetical protein